MKSPTAPALLEVEDLQVFYGKAHALQGVSFSLSEGVLGVVGRNGMGKTTLCKALTGLVPAQGRVRLGGREILGLAPHAITQLGMAYVPQGRRMWPTLSVEETLRLVAPQRSAVDRVYALFPRLAERRHHGGSQLSGGEQQMLAIGRALLLQPRVLVMDEPTEGLAPVIVAQVQAALRQLAEQDHLAILLIEQNLAVATATADRIAVMVNGRLQPDMPVAQLAHDKALQERLLGLRAGPEAETDPAASAPAVDPAPRLRVQRQHPDRNPPLSPGLARPVASRHPGEPAPSAVAPTSQASTALASSALAGGPAVWVAGTFDTKAQELMFLRDCLERLGVRTRTVDLSTSGRPSPAMVHPREVARCHPEGEAAVFVQDRGRAVAAMAHAFERYVQGQRDVAGVLSAAGSGGSALVSAGMRALPVGRPKLLVSTMASGDVRHYVGASDVCLMYAVTDVQGLHHISEQVLSNAAHAMAGMVRHARRPLGPHKPALGLTMFGVTTPCVQAVTRQLQAQYECLVFHATGTGGQSMEKLASGHQLCGAIDITTTEIADELCGGTLSAGPQRLDVWAREPLPYVGAAGALDMVNFGPPDQLPASVRQRRLYHHNPHVTLMRTNAQECQRIGEYLAHKLNAMAGPVRFLVPALGFSAIDREGQPFHDPQADGAFIDALRQHFTPSAQHQLQVLPLHINDEAFAQALVAAWHEIAPEAAPH